MSKRKQWTKREDDNLKNQITSEKRQIIWEVISHKLKKKGIKKTAKQCRERWIHNLDPKVKKKKWTKFENNLLFDKFKEKGNKWKSIANEFKGRTDNSVKNNFFSLIRKSLRLICKILGGKRNTIRINKIKGGILTDFMKSNLFVDFRGVKEFENIGGFHFEHFDKNFILENYEFKNNGNIEINLEKHLDFKNEKIDNFQNICEKDLENLSWNKNDFKGSKKNEKLDLGEFSDKKINFKHDIINKKFEIENFSDKIIVDASQNNSSNKKSNFEKIDFNYFNLNFEDKRFNLDLKNNKKEIFEIEIHKFIKKLAFSNFDEIYQKINKKDFFILQKIIEKLFQLNFQNFKQENIKISKTSSLSKIYFSDESELRKIENISKNLNFSNGKNSNKKKK